MVRDTRTPFRSVSVLWLLNEGSDLYEFPIFVKIHQIFHLLFVAFQYVLASNKKFHSININLNPRTNGNIDFIFLQRDS